MKSCECVLAAVQKIKFFTDTILTKTKFHITIGHQTAVGLVHFFSYFHNDLDHVAQKLIFNQGSLKNLKNDFKFDYNQQYDFENEVIGDAPPGAKKKEEEKKAIQEEAKDGGDGVKNKTFFAIIQLEHPILIQQ